MVLLWYMSFGAHMHTFLLGTYLGVEWLGSKVYVRLALVDMLDSLYNQHWLYNQQWGRFSAAPCPYQHMRFSFSL